MKKSSGENVETPRSFNLVDEPWIPVVDAEGATFKVGLRELFERSEKIADLSVGTLERISLYRLLICIAQRALICDEEGGGGLQNNDRDEWREAGERFVDAALAYLDQWRDRFDLWGDRPFLQVKALVATTKHNTDKLSLGLAAGNNKTLFDQVSTPEGREHASDWLARNLLVFLSFTISEKLSDPIINGRKIENLSRALAPCAERGMTIAFLKGKNLAQTIAWNLIPFDDEDFGKPAWEYDDFTSETAREELAESYSGRLVPVSRFMRLENCRKMILTKGTPYPQFEPKERENREPMATIVKTDKKEKPWDYVKTDHDRRPWRSLHAMLDWSAFKEENARYKGAWNLRNVDWVSEEDRRKSKKFAIWVGGFQTERGGKIVDSAYWNANIPWSYANNPVENTRLSNYARGVKLANGAETRLLAAVKKYCEILGASTQTNTKSKTSLVVQAKNRFWTALERRVAELIAEAAEEKSGLERWKETLRKEVVDAYEKTCACVTARQLRAFAEGKTVLFGSNNKSGDDKNASPAKSKRKSAKK